MNKRWLLLSGMAIASLALGGCISPRSFVDPSFPKVSYEDLKKRNEPLRLKLVVAFQRNGVPFPRADSTLRDHAERILRSSGLILPSGDASEGEINLVVNNVADVGSAAAKGFGTGLTLGLVGTTVVDAYEMTISITANGKTIGRTAIKHALHTAIGNTSLPDGLEGVSPETAFARVLEQMVLRALQEMQKSGDLAALKASSLMIAAPSGYPVSR